MKYVLAIMLIVAASIPSWSQTAQVVELAPADASRVSIAYARLAAAQAEVEKLKTEISAKYLQVPQGDKEQGNCSASVNGTSLMWADRRKDQPVAYWRAGFECGQSWEFSSNFRFVVPKPFSQQAPSIWTIPGSGGLQFSPARADIR